jgi:hypothetical protein
MPAEDLVLSCACNGNTIFLHTERVSFLSFLTAVNLFHILNKCLYIYSDYEEAVPPSNTNEPNNQTDENALPSSSQPASTANTSVDSGLSNSSSAVSSVSLPQRPFQGLGLSSNAVVSVEQPLTVHTRSHSDDDVSTSARSPKRARRDSGAQSLDDNPAPINVVVINVQNHTAQIHK